MSEIKEKVRLVYSNLAKRSYKYWDGELYDDGTVISRYGVVGAKNPQSRNYGRKGESFFRKKIQEKDKKGYKPAKVLMEGEQTASPVSSGLADLAVRQIKGQGKDVVALIRRLANSNVHKITTSTNITFDDGVFQTPLGVVTQEGIDEARDLLSFFYKNIKRQNTPKFHENIDEYLQIIPRPQGRRIEL